MAPVLPAKAEDIARPAEIESRDEPATGKNEITGGAEAEMERMRCGLEEEILHRKEAEQRAKGYGILLAKIEAEWTEEALDQAAK